MATISSGILTESNFMNLKAMNTNEIRSEVFHLLIDDEQPVAAFKTVRDQVIFTTKRIFVVNVQGITGKKISYFSYPYSKVQYFGVETAGLLDSFIGIGVLVDRSPSGMHDTVRITHVKDRFLRIS